MQTISKIADIRDIIKAERKKDKTIGLVPTMGNLHAGHISLVEQMHQHADIVITSIFVNPLQFSPNEDFDTYPKTMQADQEKLEAAGNHYIFAPSATEIYPEGTTSKTLVSVNALDGILCGKSRPTHLTGVATVVTKLFNIIMPDHAIFGLKDYQQLMVIKQMAIDLCMPINIIGAPIVRDDAGLALSSRNNYLSGEQQQIAPRLNQILNFVKQAILDGENNFRELEKQTMLIIEESGFKPDYFEIRTQNTLKSATIADHKLAIFVAAFLGKTRLIDNVRFENNEKNN
ncbi:MAG: pantoate--beta-alanine ligase [Alphaproteobacteria bacterium]|nr:pantoate--beta-alanine ligase [Alphaproteobacteria bacterium]